MQNRVYALEKELCTARQQSQTESITVRSGNNEGAGPVEAEGGRLDQLNEANVMLVHAVQCMQSMLGAERQAAEVISSNAASILG